MKFRLWGQIGILSFKKQVELILKAAKQLGFKTESLDLNQIPSLKNPRPDKQLNFYVGMPSLMFLAYKLSLNIYNKNCINYITLEGIPHIDPTKRDLFKRMRIITNSRSSAGYLEAAGVKCEGYVYHSWDPEELIKAKQLKLEYREQYKDHFLVGYVGSPIKRKGLDLLGQAAQILYKKYGNKILFLLWTQNYPGCNIPAGENIIFLDKFGSADHIEVMNFYLNLDLYVQPSLAEGFCIPLLEAQAAGIPAVAVEGGPMAELVNKKRGYLVPVKEVKYEDLGMQQDFVMYYYDPKDLAAAIAAAYENPIELKEKTFKAKEWAKKFTWDKTYIPLIRMI